jgi:glycosyltransferase involved in cell wall biosynthesis
VFGYPKFDRIIDERFKVKLDLFICFNYELISLSSRLKKIVVAHDLSFAINPDWFSLKRRIKYQWLMNPYNFFKQTDLIIAVSENTKRDLMDLYKISENKIKVIYPGVSDLTNQAERNYLIDEATKINLKSNEAIKEKLNLPEKFILFLGTIEPRKNILGIIKAFETWKKGSKIAEDYFLVLAGARGQASKGIWKAIKKSPFKDKIKYLSYVDENEKFVLYRLAKLFLYPSFYEGFGFPPLEAMSCGTPVIASISSSFPEVLGDSALLINPYDINDIVRGIEVMLENQEIRERFVKNGLERVKIFNWEKCALEWVNLISKF